MTTLHTMNRRRRRAEEWRYHPLRLFGVRRWPGRGVTVDMTASFDPGIVAVAVTPDGLVIDGLARVEPIMAAFRHGRSAKG